MNTLLDLAGGIAQESPSAAIFFPSIAHQEPPPAALVFPPTEDDGPATSLPALRLVGVLQTSLELEQILRLFSAELAPLVNHEGLTFFPPTKGGHLALGQRAHYSVSYCLTLYGHSLGTLLVYRDRRFTKNEVKTLEDLMRGLVYPLRNALLYQEALAAALRDPLTGIGNRAALDQALDREVKLARRSGASLSLLILDVDHFKRVNDTYGHAAGDCVLRTLAHCVTTCVRTTDLVARFGGEELAVLLNNTDAHGAYLLAERIRVAIEATQIQHNNQTIQVTVSIGVSDLHPKDDERNLFCRADAALYRAKETGRNRVRYGSISGETMTMDLVIGETRGNA
ncbi:GGDEF domain-containing protein [Gammaproteobacteria bacterium]